MERQPTTPPQMGSAGPCPLCYSSPLPLVPLNNIPPLQSFPPLQGHSSYAGEVPSDSRQQDCLRAARLLYTFPHQQHDHLTLSDVNLDRNYTYIASFFVTNRDRLKEVTDKCALLSGSVLALVKAYNFWNAAQLREVCSLHNVPTPEMLRPRSAPSNIPTSSQLAPAPPSFLPSVQWLRDEMYGHLTPPSISLKKAIIDEWQCGLEHVQGEYTACAVCAKKILTADARQIHSQNVDLALLRNELLPDHIVPTSYDFAVYDKAILHWRGLVNPWGPGMLRTCGLCHRSLTVNHTMPKFALANFLYYGDDALPQDVRKSFHDATSFDLLLVSRARATKISFRFSELEGHPLAGTSYVTSQRCIKGNLLVLPQDSTRLQSVLPPTQDHIRDTVCAVFVGGTKPTKETIAKLHPVLVRKSRVEMMIKFLIKSNPYYATSDSFAGFSQQNLSDLFGPGTSEQDEGIPCALDLGHLPNNDALAAATSDYTPRNHTHEVTPNDRGVLLENVGFTVGSDTPSSYRQMKMKALAHCLSPGGRFVQSSAGNRPVADFANDALLSLLFPHLDPWGIGSFDHPSRKVKITVRDQLRHLLQTWDSPFQRDPEFAFVYYNILQKKGVCDAVRFRVPVSQHQHIVQQLLSVDRTRLETLIKRFQQDACHIPSDEQDRCILRLLNDVGMIGRDVPGTAAHKITLRNQIRGLINYKGTPTLFITLNPSDVHHPLVTFLASDSLHAEQHLRGETLTEWQRRLVAAKNPAACALFFHFVITSFIRVILRFGRETPGLFGKCTAYYGTVETQGKGTLHCHMVIWLAGHLPPQDLRDMVTASEDYKMLVLAWLESIIKSEPLGVNEAIPMHEALSPDPEFADRSTGKGSKVSGTYNKLIHSSEPVFETAFQNHVNTVIHNFNWHSHSATCWKYLRHGEKKTDSNCRMRIDGTTREQSVVDAETGSILLRRLHPWIANYNDVTSCLLQSNMDIKHIGSGEAAKALLYYITDYITKAPLPTHAGLTVLYYALTKLDAGHDDPSDPEKQSMRTVTATVNKMLSKQEISHQQVMAELIGGGDHYCSHTFALLHWAAFSRLFRRYDNSDVNTSSPEPAAGEASAPSFSTVPSTAQILTEMEQSLPSHEEGRDPEEEFITLVLGAGTISAVSQQNDYMHRPHEEEFAAMSLYEFVASVDKIAIPREKKRKRDSSRGIRRGRVPNVRGRLQPAHPQHDSHVLRKRDEWAVPVVLGPTTPRKDRTEQEGEMWARMMCILFLTWRLPSDLCHPAMASSWKALYESRCSEISYDLREITRNMSIFSECKDVRDTFSASRRRDRDAYRSQYTSNAYAPITIAKDIDNALQQSSLRALYRSEVFDGFDQHRENPDSDLLPTVYQLLGQQIGSSARDALNSCYKPTEAGEPSSTFLEAHVAAVRNSDEASIRSERRIMNACKRSRRPARRAEPTVNDTSNTYVAHRDHAPNLHLNTLQSAYPGPQAAAAATASFFVIVDDIVTSMGLSSNPEQERAFRLVAMHLHRGTGQLLMYIAGVGGTGKTHVIRAILRLFECLGRSHEIIIGAPTGAAALLVGGFTVHSLTMLPNEKKKDFSDLRSLWQGIRYFIIDEVSMIGAKFLSQISNRLRQSQGEIEIMAEQIFGGVNMIFTGDFGQLKPVAQKPLYSHLLVDNPGFDQARNSDAIDETSGAFLWRQVDTVVKLTRSQRQADDLDYAELLGRIRVGQTLADGSDFRILQRRVMHYLRCHDPDSMTCFADAPIIVGSKDLRDILNAQVIEHKARQMKQAVYLYHSKDSFSKGDPLSEEDMDYYWGISSSVSDDSLGRLPLFVGMRAMVLENLAFGHSVVNSAEGDVVEIKYDTDNEGRRFPRVVYLSVPGAGTILPHKGQDIVPIFPQRTSFPVPVIENGCIVKRHLSRLQLPIIPSYAYTDYKSQGKSLTTAIVDIQSAKTIQGIYVMLSRVKNLRGLGILRPFHPSKIDQRLSEELRNELDRIDGLDRSTRVAYAAQEGEVGEEEEKA